MINNSARVTQIVVLKVYQVVDLLLMCPDTVNQIQANSHHSWASVK